MDRLRAHRPSTFRAWAAVLAAACGLTAAGWAAAQTAPRCDAAPNTNVPKPGAYTLGRVGEAQCDATGIPGMNLAVPNGTPVPGGKLAWTDSRTQFECEQWVWRNGGWHTNGGTWKRRTICGPNHSYMQDRDGNFRCQAHEPVMWNPRQDCLRSVNIRVNKVTDDRGNGNFSLFRAAAGSAPLQHRLLIEGPDVASATDLNVEPAGPGGAPWVPGLVRAWIERGPNPYVTPVCAGPNCLMIKVALTSNAPLGPFRLSLVPPAPAAGTHIQLSVANAPTLIAAGGPVSVGRVGAPAPGPSLGSGSATAGVDCPVTVTRGNGPTPESLTHPSNPFTLNQARQVRLTSLLTVTRDSAGLPMVCRDDPWPGNALSIVIANLSGGSDVMVNWTASGPRLENVNLDQTITLPAGTWQLRPYPFAADTTYLPGSYTASW